MKKMMVSLLIVCLFFSTGCEPLRKKFVRKKKAKDNSQFVPILEPLEYPEGGSAQAKYQHHYMLWTIWQRELSTVLIDGGTDKKIQDLLERLRTHFEQMEPLLTGEKHALLVARQNDVINLQEAFAKPAAVRNQDVLKKKVVLLGKHVRMELQPEMVKESLTP
ncbi:MAG: hypothetical protein NUV91_06920 [Candidatus Omnitrophica bacterium]|nr:hypothetical protein [Candidatus Omnitrophota bacterium]